MGATDATIVKDGGLTSFAFLRGAARNAAIELAEPNAGLGNRAALDIIGHEHGFALERIIEARFDEPLNGNAVDAFNHILDQGLAEPLRNASKRSRDKVLATYHTEYTSAIREGQGSHSIQFVKYSSR